MTSTQSNSADNSAAATNDNITGQYVAQGQGASTIAVGGRRRPAAARARTRSSTTGPISGREAGVDNEPVQRLGTDVGRAAAVAVTPRSPTRPPTRRRPATATTRSRTCSRARAASTVALGGSAYGGAQDQIADVINTTYQSADADVANGQSNVSAPDVGRGRWWRRRHAVELGGQLGGGDQRQHHRPVRDPGPRRLGGVWRRVGADQTRTPSSTTGPTSGPTPGSTTTSNKNVVGAGDGRRRQRQAVADTSTQSNEATNSATAENSNDTIQAVLQGQAASAAGQRATTTRERQGQRRQGQRQRRRAPARTRRQGRQRDRPVGRGHRRQRRSPNVAAGVPSAAGGGGDVRSPTRPTTRPRRQLQRDRPGRRPGPGGLRSGRSRTSRPTSTMPPTSRPTPR